MVAADERSPGAEPVRLARYLAHGGVASRRAAEELIAAGRVRVDGAAVTDPARDVGDSNRVEVDGERVTNPSERVVYAVNKPRGVVSTARDTHGRPTVVALVAAKGLRLYPVGRLDADTTGLILLTNDGELANLLTHPRYEVPKTYRAKLAGGPIEEAALARLRSGVQLEDGCTAPARVRRLGPAEIELTIREGRKRQVRRMCAAVGHPVRDLTRTGFGGLKLGSLASGAYRRLGEGEVDALRAQAALPESSRP
jgi:23S rRNA pseudouridine2605 synthase